MRAPAALRSSSGTPGPRPGERSFGRGRPDDARPSGFAARAVARVFLYVFTAVACVAALAVLGTHAVRAAETVPAVAADVVRSAVPADVWADEPRVRAVLEPGADFDAPERFERMQAGAATAERARDANAYSHPLPKLAFEDLNRFKLGNALFNKSWVSSPSSTQASDGLGPFYSARACEGCHMKDGRGHLPTGDERTASFVLQLRRPIEAGAEVGDDVEVAGTVAALGAGNVPGGDPDAPTGWGGDPVYGNQLHVSAVPGVAAEGLVRIEHEPWPVPGAAFPDGTPRTLPRPVYAVDELGYGPLDPATRLSPRLAPAMAGVGLLGAIDEADLLAYADPDDADGDGVSGRPNLQALPDGTVRMGRFGLKAATATVEEQVAHALFVDMGLSNPRLPGGRGDCTKAQTVCDDLADGVQPRLGDAEVPDPMLELMTFYSERLAVPVRADVDDPEVLAGKAAFASAGCTGCHVPKHVTSRDAAPELAFQLIWPYTDLLLHDMGEGLADGAGEGVATGTEWRTAPLWGIGAAKVVNPRTSYLHDGRADTLMDAVLWHGGEATASRDAVLGMPDAMRAALVRFLESL